jgi:hypothetical protein
MIKLFEEEPPMVVSIIGREIDVGKLDLDYKGNERYDENMDFVIQYKSAMKKTRGKTVKLNLRGSENVFTDDNGTKLIGPSIPFWDQLNAFLSDESLGRTIDKITKKGHGKLSDNDKKELIAEIQAEYLGELRNGTIKVLSGSVLGDMLVRAKDNEKRALTEKQMLEQKLLDIEMESSRVLTESGRGETLTRIGDEMTFMKQVAPIQITKEEKDKK